MKLVDDDFARESVKKDKGLSFASLEAREVFRQRRSQGGVLVASAPEARPVTRDDV